MRGDIYEAIRVTSHHTVVTTYKYGQRGSLRWWQTGHAHLRHIFIWNQERQTAYELDPDTREYIEAFQTDFVALFARWIARPHIRQSGKMVDVHYETIDTGERRQILGQTAKHLRLRERHVAVPGACDSSSLIEEDGWYIALPERDPGSLGTISNQPVFRHYEPGEVDNCRDTVRKHGDPPTPGLLVLQEKKASRLEVIALSTTPLDHSSFEVPSDYKRVDHFQGGVALTWTDRLAWDWHQLVGALSTWFGASYDKDSMDGLGILILGGLASLFAFFVCLLMARLRRYALAALISPFASSIVFLIGMFLLADMNPAAEYRSSYIPVAREHNATAGHILLWLLSVVVTFFVSGFIGVKAQRILHKMARYVLSQQSSPL